jgi:RNA 2',3'-cyclic 3'-phosphodiesterase
MPRRIFLSINLPVKIKNTLILFKEKWPQLPARWTQPENLHITLLFFGNTGEQELKKIQERVRKVVFRYAPFTLQLSCVQYGPDAKNPRMIWAKGEDSRKLEELQKDLAKALGQQKDHAFSLHITLARIKEWEFQRIDPEERPHIDEKISLEIPVHALDIMESKLQQKGSQYSIIESISL